jgi:hypothetical protein
MKRNRLCYSLFLYRNYFLVRTICTGAIFLPVLNNNGVLLPAGDNPYVTRHFLVQCTAEIGTIHREYAHPVGVPLLKSVFHPASPVALLGSAFNGEAMRYIPVLLNVWLLEIHFVAHSYAFDIIRCKVRTDSCHIHMYLFPSLTTFVLLRHCRSRDFIFFHFKELNANCFD